MSNMSKEPSLRCPDCGSFIMSEPDCPGYIGDGGEVYLCRDCQNATLYVCVNPACSWEHRDPNLRDSAKGAQPKLLETT